MPPIDTPVSTDPVLEMLRDIKRDGKDTRNALSDINREMGGIQSTLKSMEKANEKRDQEVATIRTNQANCEARTLHKGLTARVKKLERADKDITGSVDVVSQRQQALEYALTKRKNGNGNGVKLGEAFRRTAPWLVMAILVGAALGGFGLAWFMLNGRAAAASPAPQEIIDGQ